MTNMNLILQGLQVDAKVVEKIAALADAQTITAINTDAWRCAGVSHSAPVRALIEAACLHAKIDGSFIDENKKLADFKLLVMDMDSTLITIECIDEIADMQGLKSEVSAITEAAMRGELEFRESLTRRVALLEGLDASALQQVFDERLLLSLGAYELLAGAKKAGLRTVLVSGGFTYFTDRLQQQLHFDVTRANSLEIINGKLTGKIVGEIIDATEKRKTVENQAAALGVETSSAIVMGDGANDLEMMSVAGLSVAFRAKPVVRAQADVALNFAGLDGVLNLFR
jgi:phosphoserine phosphatase